MVCVLCLATIIIKKNNTIEIVIYEALFFMYYTIVFLRSLIFVIKNIRREKNNRYYSYFYLFFFQEGSIGHDIVIRPVPTELTEQYKDIGAHHIVYKRKVDNMDQNSDFGKYYLYCAHDHIKMKFIHLILKIIII